jgi:hypothetical protein
MLPLLHSVHCRNEVASSSLNDVGYYVIIKNPLQSILNMLPVFRKSLQPILNILPVFRKSLQAILNMLPVF